MSDKRFEEYQGVMICAHGMPKEMACRECPREGDKLFTAEDFRKFAYFEYPDPGCAEFIADAANAKAQPLVDELTQLKREFHKTRPISEVEAENIRLQARVAELEYQNDGMDGELTALRLRNVHKEHDDSCPYLKARAALKGSE